MICLQPRRMVFAFEILPGRLFEGPRTYLKQSETNLMTELQIESVVVQVLIVWEIGLMKSRHDLNSVAQTVGGNWTVSTRWEILMRTEPAEQVWMRVQILIPNAPRILNWIRPDCCVPLSEQPIVSTEIQTP